MIELIPTRDDERENFIKNIQAAFKKAVVEEYGDDGKEIGATFQRLGRAG